jgi:diguanylate cyclase (GGDEF)-like protein
MIDLLPICGNSRARARPSTIQTPVLPRDLSLSSLTIDRRRAEFADRASEARFTRHFLAERNRQLKASLLFAAAFYVAFAATDFATLGDTAIARMLAVLRVGVALVGLGCFAAIVRRPRSVRVSIGAACTLLVVALAVFMVVCWFQPQVLAWNAMSQALILMAVYVNFPNRFIYAAAIGVGSSAVFAAMLAIQGNLRADDLLTLVLLLVMGNALGCIAACRFHVAQREQFRASIQLQQLADRDPLTGCYNRRFLQKGLLNAELERTRRYGSPLSVVLCDIDHFKRINDTYGHAAGDQVLADFAGLLMTLTRDTVDSVVRYGGEEFLLVLPQTDLAGAQALAERIRAAFADAPDASIKATASFGIAAVPAQTPAPPASSEALIGAADAQLYAAKRGGRNMVCATVAGR